MKFEPEVGQDPNNPMTWVCAFPEAAPKGALTRDNVDAFSQLEWYLKVRRNWCEHNASNTVYVKPGQWMAVGSWVYAHFDEIIGVSFLPYDSGTYKLAPYEEISHKQYEKFLQVTPTIDYSQLSRYELEDNTEGAKTLACTADRCELK
jgi:ribonucleoside-diphosphate reductase alpha chain